VCSPSAASANWKKEQGKKFHRIERAYGRCARFVLPDNVDPTKVTASMKDGVLEVRLVKADKPNRNRLKSQSANFNQRPKS
jgi:HSP20 family protein